MRFCICGCGNEVKNNKKFIWGHNQRGSTYIRTSIQKRRISEGTKRAMHRLDIKQKHLKAMANPLTRLKIALAKLGDKNPMKRLEVRQKSQKATKVAMKNFLGKNAPNWKGGISFEPYSSDFTNELKDEIRKRDNYRCQECGALQIEFSTLLPAHHIDYNKKNCKKDNLITLCISCNAKANWRREEWQMHYTQIMKLRKEKICS